MDDRERLEQRLAALEERVAAPQRRTNQRESGPDLDELAAEQGVESFDWDAYQRQSPVWPEDEDVDEFNAWVRQTRHGDTAGGLG